MRIETWLSAMKADAESRGLPELAPLLEALARSTAALRRADWNDAADRPVGNVPRAGQSARDGS
ncbi:MAG: hypothetical protein QGG24_05445 [Vicinamibacterales bacterium]|jgi:hypothetical protein|nr:hypothetical protein [Vicinamibacterales bacterium]MDP7471873.1 hypothetical protein [Vicinamibacterales bacterium]MDP7671533.1 hypothetical protein [Vicinamibacterales bacterium]HJO39464.1 hypothetical protein [Vicinamibacterales bacterium]